MKNKEIISAVVGSAFFAVPYIGLSVAALPALAIGCAAFGASELVLSGITPRQILKNTDKSVTILQKTGLLHLYTKAATPALAINN